MKKSLQILTVSAALVLSFAACHKKENAGTASSSADEVKMKASYGFLAQVPGDVEMALAEYHPAEHIQNFLKSKTWQAISANPLVQPQLAKMSEKFTKCSASNPDCVKVYGILQEAANHEIDIVSSKGAAAAIQNLYRISDEINTQNYALLLAATPAATGSSAATPVPTISPLVKDPGAPFCKALIAEANTLEVPSFYIALDVPTQKAAAGEEVTKLLTTKLPKEIQPVAVTISGAPFKSVAFTIGQVLPQAQKEKLKAEIARNESDAQKADAALQTLLGKHVDITYGALGDYFIVSVGPDHSHLKFADKFADSILATPAAAPLAAYADKSPLAVGINSKALAEGVRRVPQYSASLEQLKPELAKSLSPQDLQKLTDTVKRIDGEIAALLKPKSISALTAVEWIDKGFHEEIFGGVQYEGAAPLKLAGVPTADTLLWIDGQIDPAKRAEAGKLLEDVATNGYDLFHQIGVPKLDAQQRMQAGMFQVIALPKLVELYKITRDQLSKSFGTESAFAIDLNGPVPALPQVPPAIQKDGKAPRIAMIREVKDPALLAQSWQSYWKLANDTIMATPLASKFPKGLPQPETQAVNGTTLSYYSLPIPTGDLLPVVATNGKTAVFSTSKSYALALSEAAAKSTPSAKSYRFEFKLNTAAGLDYAQQWVNLVAANPDLFFTGPTGAQKKAEFIKDKPNVDQLLQTLHAFPGIDLQSFEENGQNRVSVFIPFND